MNTTDLRALTVHQPWAAAIVHGGKDVENRTRRTHHRGLILIHSGQTYDFDAGHHELDTWIRSGRAPRDWAFGAIIGAAEITGCHPADGTCCPSWGETEPGVWHWTLAGQCALTEPVGARGMLGFWRPSAEVLEKVAAQLEAGAR
ncbi:MAG TPA: hypothetical protein VN088_06010 [Nocardioides sp.]|nr:hypothetical protein [Nocardioides sp.]